MAFQFMHVEGYGRSAGRGKTGGHTMASIVAEAERHPGACPHVDAPARPRLLFGRSPSEAAALATQWADQATDSRGHRLRKDALCMLGGVVSLPPGTSEKQWIRYRDDSLKWLKKEYGDRLVGVIEHTDEPHPHIHFYAVPRVGERFDQLHDGLRAAREANPDRGKRSLPGAEKTAAKKEAMLAYAEAMRTFQDRFYSAVSQRHGLARIGPGRRRLTRAAWQAEEAARKADAERIQEIERRAARAEAVVTAAQDRNREAMEKAFNERQALEAIKAGLPKLPQWFTGLSPDQINQVWQDVARLAEAERTSQEARQGTRTRQDGKSHGKGR